MDRIAIILDSEELPGLINELTSAKRFDHSFLNPTNFKEDFNGWLQDLGIRNDKGFIEFDPCTCPAWSDAIKLRFTKKLSSPYVLCFADQEGQLLYWKPDNGLEQRKNIIEWVNLCDRVIVRRPVYERSLKSRGIHMEPGLRRFIVFGSEGKRGKELAEGNAGTIVGRFTNVSSPLDMIKEILLSDIIGPGQKSLVCQRNANSRPQVIITDDLMDQLAKVEKMLRALLPMAGIENPFIHTILSNDPAELEKLIEDVINQYCKSPDMQAVRPAYVFMDFLNTSTGDFSLTLQNIRTKWPKLVIMKFTAGKGNEGESGPKFDEFNQFADENTDKPYFGEDEELKEYFVSALKRMAKKYEENIVIYLANMKNTQKTPVYIASTELGGDEIRKSQETNSKSKRGPKKRTIDKSQVTDKFEHTTYHTKIKKLFKMQFSQINKISKEEIQNFLATFSSDFKNHAQVKVFIINNYAKASWRIKDCANIAFPTSLHASSHYLHIKKKLEP